MPQNTIQVLDSIQRVLRTLDQDRILERLSHNCVLASEMIQNMLYSYGVSSRCVEVTLMVSKSMPDGSRNIHAVGYDGFLGNEKVDTHVIVVTQTQPSIMIDASVGYLFNDPKHVIVQELTVQDDPDIVCSIAPQPGSEMTYRLKKNIRLATFHQRNLVDRIRQEYDLLRNVHWLKIAVMVSLGLSVINFILNAILVMLKITYL